MKLNDSAHIVSVCGYVFGCACGCGCACAWVRVHGCVCGCVCVSVCMGALASAIRREGERGKIMKNIFC